MRYFENNASNAEAGYFVAFLLSRPWNANLTEYWFAFPNFLIETNDTPSIVTHELLERGFTNIVVNEVVNVFTENLHLGLQAATYRAWIASGNYA